MLTVPAPTLAFDALPTGAAPREKPLSITLGAVVRDDVALGPADLDLAGLHVFRRTGAGAPREAWSKDAAAWVPDPSPDLAALAVDPLAFQADAAQPWQGLVVAVGTAGDGADKFATGSGDFPAYAFRARFVAKDGEAVLSAPTPEVTFGSLADATLIVLGPAEGETPDAATLVRLELRSPALVTIGGLVIRRAAPGAEIVLGNAAGAAVVLEPDGSIELRPAPGRGVRVAGDLETERILYAPAGGGLKKTLG